VFGGVTREGDGIGKGTRACSDQQGFRPDAVFDNSIERLTSLVYGEGHPLTGCAEQ